MNVEQNRPRPDRTFNPNEHTIQLKSKDGAKDYLPVLWRLVWFREKCPHGTIETEMLHLDLDRVTEEEAYVWSNEKRRSEKVVKQANGFVLFKATVKDGNGGIGTGTKSEKAASFPDFIEKAETGAIGRALAALGYGTQFAPELSEAHRIVDSPVDRQPVANGNGQGQTAATEPQIAAITEQQLSSIRKLCEYLGRPEPENVATISNVSAKKLINLLTAEYRDLKQSQAKPATTAAPVVASAKIDTQRSNELYLAAKGVGCCADPTEFREFSRHVLGLEELATTLDMTVEQAKRVEDAIQRKREAQPKGEQATTTQSTQNKALVEMISRSKKRVESIGMLWADIKHDALLQSVEDMVLTVAQVAEINATIARYEQPMTPARS